MPKDAVAICKLFLFTLLPTQTYPCLKDAVKGPFISNEPVICRLFEVAYIEPVCLNIPSAVAVQPPNDEVATNVALLPAPPTQAYPLANDAVNAPDADI